MQRSCGDGCALAFRLTAALTAALAACGAARGGAWTWTGLGSNDNWSTAANWSPAGPPSSDNATTLIFDNSARLAPQQDLLDTFQFGALVFSNHAGAFVLGGATNASGALAWRNLQFSGSNSCLVVAGGGEVAIRGALITPASAATQTVNVAAGMTLHVPWIKGGLRRVVVKRGAGTLRVYEHEDGQHYLEKSTTVAPEYRVEDGLVEMGTRTDRFVLGSDGASWKADPAEVKASYSLAIGDGLGAATSAVFRLIGPAQTQLLDNNLAITVAADGLLDFNGVQNWDPDAALSLLASNGLTRLGGSSLYLRPGHTLDLRGSTRLEGSGTSAIRFYDGSTNVIAGTGAVIAVDAALVSATNGAGVVFDVSGALACTGHLGAGGAGTYLVKRGSGTLTLANLSHAARTNRVEEGTLLLHGVSRCPALSSVGAAWQVSSNAVLGGCGSISNAAVVVQGTLAPEGTFTVEAGLALFPGAALEIDISPQTCDRLVLEKGALSGLTNATLHIALHGRPDVDGRTFRIVSGGGDLTGQMFQAVTLSGLPNRRAEITTGNGFIDLTIHNRLAGTGVMVR